MTLNTLSGFSASANHYDDYGDTQTHSHTQLMHGKYKKE